MEVGHLAGEAVFELAVDHAPIGIAFVDLEGRWLRVNPELCRMLGRPAADLLGTAFQDITHPDDLEADLGQVRAVLAGDASGYRMDKRYLRPDGSVLWAQLDVVLVRDGDRPLYFVSQLQDVGARRAAEAHLEQLALRDPLTGLPNRALFRDRVAHALAGSTRSGRRVAVGFVDLDDFKLVNDTRGHHVGDRILVEVGRRFAASVRPGDTLARFGGDEFIVLITEVDDAVDAAAVLGRVLTTLDTPVEVGPEDHLVSASGGLTVSTPASTVDDLLRHADLAMYAGKEGGKGGLVIYDDTMEVAALARVALERDLHRAVRDDEVHPAYQPMVDLADDTVVGYEVLARWDRDPAAPVEAASFIPAASRAGLLPRMTVRLLQRIEDDLPRLALGPDGLLAVNVTASVLADPSVRVVLGALAERLPGGPDRLVLEVAQSEILLLDGAAGAALAELRTTGIRLSVDDFGTGTSSLAAMIALQPDLLKIDLSFTHALDDPVTEAIVRAICRMNTDLGIRTVGEGVERVEQAERLRSVACPWAQGYHYGRPLPIDRLEARVGRPAPPPR